MPSDNNITTQTDFPARAISVVVPIQFYKDKGNPYSRDKKFDTLYTRVKQNIKCLSDRYEWVEVDDPNNDTEYNDNPLGSCRKIKYEDAFESAENLKIEKEYFCREFFDALYDYGKTKSSHRVLILSKKDSTNKVDISDDKLGFSFKTGNGEVEYGLVFRKVYLMMYSSCNALIVAELSVKDQFQNKDALKKSLIHDKISVKYTDSGTGEKKQDLEGFLLGHNFQREDNDENANVRYFRPFKHNRFVFVYDKKDIIEMKYYRLSTEEIGHLVENRCGFEEYFSYYFQMYLNCIYVKTELFNISMRASGIANYSGFFRSNKVSGLIREYIEFINKHSHAECTYNEIGQGVFESLKDSMKIKRMDDYVNEQIAAFNNYTSSMVGTYIAVIGVIFAILQVIVPFLTRN